SSRSSRRSSRSRNRAAARAGPPPAALGRNLDDVGRLRTLRALCGLVLDLRALVQRLEAAACDAGVMHEEVSPCLIGSDEAVALRIVEPLDGSGCHENTSLAYS